MKYKILVIILFCSARHAYSQGESAGNYFILGIQGNINKYMPNLFLEHRFVGTSAITFSISCGVAYHFEKQDMSHVKNLPGGGVEIDGGTSFEFFPHSPSGYILNASSRYVCCIPKLGYRNYLGGHAPFGFYWGAHAGILLAHEDIDIVNQEVGGGISYSHCKTDIICPLVGLNAGIEHRIKKGLVFNASFELPFYYQAPIETEMKGPFIGTRPELYLGIGIKLSRIKKN